MSGVDSARRERMQEIGRAGARARKIIAIERRINELIAEVPPLTDAQRDRLAQLLRGGGAA